MKYGDEIVINRMYNGNYLNDNLGHEIINLYKSDNGQNYIYLNSLGTFSKEHANKVGSILLVRTIPNKKTLEIIGKAEGITDVYKNGNSSKEQIDYIKKNKIYYGGVRLDLLFSKNKLQQDIFITFKAETVVRPKVATYIKFGDKDEIIDNSNNIILTENKQAKTSLKQYITLETKSDYKILFNYIKNENNWNGYSEFIEEEQIDKSPDNIFKICGIEDSELAFSNAIGYFFKKYPLLLKGFLNKVGYEFTPSETIEIVREKENNIDLLIKDKNDIILIENKIKSNVNGIIFSKNAQGTEYSQLEKYYTYVTKQYPNKRIKCFILTPDYNDINLSPYKASENYSKIYYSQLYDYLNSIKTEDKYLKEFIYAIKKHTKKYDNNLYYEMKRRFFEFINELREK